MPPRIIIDGYNLIRQSKTLRAYDASDITQGREKLIERLSHYRTFKGTPLLVVFDGWQEGNPLEHRTREKGIDVIYSKRGEKADEVIKRIVSRSSEEIIVVTSDREITSFCQSRKCAVIASHVFEEKMEFSFLARVKGVDDDEDRSSLSTTTKKKGPSRRLTKSRRKALKRLKKL